MNIILLGYQNISQDSERYKIPPSSIKLLFIHYFGSLLHFIFGVPYKK